MVVTEAVNGNTVVLSNGMRVNLIGVLGSDATLTWLKKELVGDPVVVLDRHGELLENIKNRYTDGLLFTEDGVEVNKVLQDLNTSEGGKEKKGQDAEVEMKLTDLYMKYKSAVFMIYTADSEIAHQGTGFFISPEGIAVSNYHVFEGTSRGLETIRTDDVDYKLERVIAVSKERDYIVFKVGGLSSAANYFPIATSTPPIGSSVFTIGNPKGPESTLSSGIISSMRQSGALIQTTAEITHGISGGPLLNMKGEVIRITSSGIGEANLNFAININAVSPSFNVNDLQAKTP